MKFLITIGSGLTLVGCGIVGPNYEKPSISLASSYATGGSISLVEGSTTAWWQRLNDPLLDSLVKQGATQNLDVRAALERIVAADAALGQTGANSQSSGTLSGSAARRSIDGERSKTSTEQVDGSYVIDLFGGFARGREQALANFDAAQLDAGTVRLAYLADLTNSYIQARYYQEAAAITRNTIASRRSTLAIVEERNKINDATLLEVQQAKSLLAAAEAPLPVLIANFEVNVFHIATLLGEPSGPLMQKMQSGAHQPLPSGFTSIGLPADLLRNRPDVRGAERNYAAATAAVGVAEAQLYPSVSLVGTLGTGPTDRWSFGPSLSVPVLNRGFLRSRQMVAISQAREAELDWRKSVLVAVEDVQTAMTLCLNWKRQLHAQERATEASRSVLALSRDSYEQGATTLTEVLDAERLNGSNQLAVADAARNYAISWMQVQISTGQGWGAPALIDPSETQAPDLTADPLGMEEVFTASALR